MTEQNISKQNDSDKKFKLWRKWFWIGAIVLVLIFSVIFYLSKYSKQNSPTEQIVTTQPEPEKTDFGANVPADFPTNIPLEKGAEVKQSYSLNYVDQQQLSIVFLSAKTVEENYSLYSDFFQKQNWNVLNTYDSLAVSSLYSTKETNDINVTISENTSSASIRSQVSISVLKKI